MSNKIVDNGVEKFRQIMYKSIADSLENLKKKYPFTEREKNELNYAIAVLNDKEYSIKELLGDE